jgi:hypothetical protein
MGLVRLQDHGAASGHLCSPCIRDAGVSKGVPTLERGNYQIKETIL